MMNQTFEKLYGQLGRVTGLFLIAAAVGFLITLALAVLGLTQAVQTFNGVSSALGFAFVLCLAVFLMASVAAAVIRWIDRRGQTAK